MRLLLLSLLVVTYVTATPLIGEEKCAWGPTYWCSHVQHAKECGAFKHCLDTVWKMTIIKPKSTEECTYCQLLVNELRDQLHNKATQEKIAEVLANVCEFLPNADWKDQCKGIVTEDLPELIEMVDNDIDTTVICAAVGFCSGLEDTYSPYGVSTFRNDRVGNSTCSDCMTFFKDVQDSITSQETLNELEQLLNQTLCSRLPALSAPCNDLVKEFLPQALQFLASQIDPDIVCRIFGFCGTKTDSQVMVDVIPLKNVFKRTSQAPLKYHGAEECEICKDLVGQIDDVIRDKTTQDKIKQLIENEACAALGSYAEQCKTLVEEYAPLLFEFLVNELDPSTLCQTFGICPAPTLLEIIPAMKVKPASPGYVKDSVVCTVCTMVLQEVDNLLRENQTVALIERLLEKFCAKLPTEYLAKECKTYVEKYAHMAVLFVAMELDPKFICTKMGLCKKSPVALAAIMKQKDGACDLCVMVIQNIEVLLQNVSAEEIMNDLNMICSFVPFNYSSMCLKYVKDYAPIIIQLLKSKEDPKSLCSLAKVCTTTKAKLGPYMTVPIPEDPVPAKSAVSVPSPECEVCDTVLVFVKQFVSQNSTEEEVKAVLEKACSVLPASFKTECDALVQQYGDLIIKALLNNLDPHTICKEIGLCKEMNMAKAILSPHDILPIVSMENIQVPAKSAVSVPSTECVVCDTVLVFVKQFVSQNSTEEEVKAVLERACSGFPASFKTECDALVQQYGDLIIKALLNNLDPHTVCKEIGLCKEMNMAKAILSPHDTLPIVSIENIQVPVKSTVLVPSTKCKVCDTVLVFVKQHISQNSTKEEVKALLEKACSYTEFKTECDALVQQYGDVIIKELLNNLDPHAICKDIGLCKEMKAKMKAALAILSPYDTLPLVPIVNNQDVKTENPIVCEACTLVMNYVDKELQGNKTEENIMRVLEEVCSKMPTLIQSKCDDLVKTYTKEIINMFVLGFSPAEICQKLSLCTATISRKLPHLVHVKLLKDKQALTKNLEAGPACVICEFVLGELDSILKENSSQAEIEAALEKVCSLLPSTISKECSDFVTQYAPEIIQLLLQGLNPKQICSELSLCTSGQFDSLKTLVKILPDLKVGLDYCMPCKMIVEYVQQFLKENRTEAEIEQFLDKLCSILPDTVTAQCDDIVKQYIPAIIELIRQNLNSSQVCQKIGLCNATVTRQPAPYDTPQRVVSQKDGNTLYFLPHQARKPAQMLGADKCTYGPTFWCASKENAMNCNAMEHCETKVWNV